VTQHESSPAELSFITRDRLQHDLRTLGLRAGDTVMIHAAMRQVGPLLNGPDALIDAVRRVIGPDGTLMAYTDWDSVHTDLLDDDGRVLDAYRAHVPGFDACTSRAARGNGVLAEFVRTTPGAVRSANPGASMAAIGRRATWLTADHPQDYGYGPGSPLARLVDCGGRVLMVGAPRDTMTLLHYAEHLADLPGKRVLRYEQPFAGDGGTVWRWVEEFDTSEPVVDGLPANTFELIVSAYLDAGAGAVGTVGGAASVLVDAPPMLEFGVRWLEAWASGRAG
jgi:aminoglycoside 3-N-acetyltransferase